MTVLQALLLGALQGLTEFLPVSSSGHLALAQILIPGFSQPGVVFDAVLHLGTAAAVVWFVALPIMRIPGLARMARAVETHHPELAERVSSAIELLTDKKGAVTGAVLVAEWPERLAPLLSDPVKAVRMAAVARLADKVDLLYLHIDADVLDGPLMPNHPNSEPDGPSMRQTLAAVECVMATGKVAAFAVVSVYFEGQSTETDLASGVALLRGGLTSWRRYGCP